VCGRLFPAVASHGQPSHTPFSVASREPSSSRHGCPSSSSSFASPLLAHTNHLTMALVMRIKFPPTYPLIYKTLRIDSKLTANEAIHFISETLNVAIQGNVGLYIPQEHMWLDPNTPLSQYDTLHEVEEVEFRDRDQPDGGKKQAAGGGGGGCCIMM